MKRHCALVAAALLLATTAAAQPIPEDEHEPNDTLETATPIGVPGYAHGCIEPESDTDWYAFTLPQNSLLNIYIEIAGYLELFDADGILVASAEHGLYGVNTSAGEYFLRISDDVAECYEVFFYFNSLGEAVVIDIKPGSEPNCFNANGRGVIPVAVLANESFDVSNIDQTTLSFGGADVRVRGNKGPFCGLEDVNSDGFNDIVCHFEDNPDYWEPGQDEATLTGALLDGTSIEGTDSICIVP